MGLSLVELMISLVIGLLVLAAVSSVYVSGKRSYKARDGMSLLQENGRIALKRLRSGISAAGYPGYADLQPMVSGYTDLESLPVKPDKKRPNLEPSQNNIDSDRNDRLTLMYMPEGGTYTEDDCLGNESAFERLVVNSYYVSKGSLVCRGSGGTTQPLAENIEYLQFQYGLDTDGDGFADQFVPKPNADEDEWSKVVSVKVGLLVSSGAEILDQAATGRTFQVLDEEIPEHDLNPRFSYRVFSETIPIRNKMAICNDC